MGQGLSNSQEAQEAKSSHGIQSTHTCIHTHTPTHTVTHTPDSVSLGVVKFLIEEDKRRGGHESGVGSKGHTETASGGVKGLVHIATRDCLKQEELPLTLAPIKGKGLATDVSYSSMQDSLFIYHTQVQWQNILIRQVLVPVNPYQ